MTHTPGPWKPTRSNPAEGYDCWWITGNHHGNYEKDLATVAGGATTSEANARLIAAAPELLELLRKLTTMRVHDALCGAFDEWETEYVAFDAALELVARIDEGKS